MTSLRVFNTKETPIMNGKYFRTWPVTGGRYCKSRLITIIMFYSTGMVHNNWPSSLT